MVDDIISRVKIQYPTDETESLQRSIVQIKQLLEDPNFYEAIVKLVEQRQGRS